LFSHADAEEGQDNFKNRFLKMERSCGLWARRVMHASFTAKLGYSQFMNKFERVIHVLALHFATFSQQHSQGLCFFSPFEMFSRQKNIHVKITFHNQVPTAFHAVMIWLSLRDND